MYAGINGEIVDAGNSMVDFLKTCAQKADLLKIKKYQNLIEEGVLTLNDIKNIIYCNGIRGVRKSEFPETLMPLDKE